MNITDKINTNTYINESPINLDETEFKHIFEQYYRSLCSFANEYVEDWDLATDIVQEAFAKLWKIRKKFLYMHNVKAFLYTTIKNKALNELEHSKVVSSYANKINEKRKDLFFHDLIIEKETYRILAEAIAKLPERTREIMQLALDENSNAEIAEKLQISKETVHTLKKTAYKRLRFYFKDYYYILYLLMI